MLRKYIDEAIKNTAKNRSKTNKIKIAKEVVKLNPEIENPEMQEKLEELVERIETINNL